jgi:prepilin-type N-terminal cleavage/methylation domain-containing protein
MNFNNKGFTLLEMIIALGIGSMLVLASAWFLISSLRQSNIVFDQLASQSDGRRVLHDVVNDVRRAVPSSIGAYPIETAGTSTLVLYANVDSDNYIERVRYFLYGNVLRRGVINPSGSPLTYPSANEAVTDVAHYVANTTSTPIFTYYNESYTGTEAALTQPVSTTQIHVITVTLDMEKDPAKAPVPIRVQSTVQVRNLKTN